MGENRAEDKSGAGSQLPMNARVPIFWLYRMTKKMNVNRLLNALIAGRHITWRQRLDRDDQQGINARRIANHDFFSEAQNALLFDNQIVKETDRKHRHRPILHGSHHLKV
jgi:hypothetical protein